MLQRVGADGAWYELDNTESLYAATMDKWRCAQYLEFAERWHSFSRNFGKEVGLFAGLQHALRLAHEQTRAVYFERSAIKLRIRSTVAS